MTDALLGKSSGVNADWKYDIPRGWKGGGLSWTSHEILSNESADISKLFQTILEFSTFGILIDVRFWKLAEGTLWKGRDLAWWPGQKALLPRGNKCRWFKKKSILIPLDSSQSGWSDSRGVRLSQAGFPMAGSTCKKTAGQTLGRCCCHNFSILNFKRFSSLGRCFCHNLSFWTLKGFRQPSILNFPRFSSTLSRGRDVQSDAGNR